MYDIESNECPVSLITLAPWGPEIRTMVTEISQGMRIKELTGAWAGGNDSSRWDARWFDAVDVAEMERRRTERAYDEAAEGVRRSIGERR